MNEDFNTTLAAEWEEYLADIKSMGADISEANLLIAKKIYHTGAIAGVGVLCGMVKQSAMSPAEKLKFMAYASAIFTEANAELQ